MQQSEQNRNQKSVRRKHLRQRIRTAPRKAYKSKVVRYVISGGSATVVDVGSYFITYNFILHKQPFVIGMAHIGAHIAALCLSFSLGLITNFLITKYFVFNESDLRGREQFVRYVAVAAITFVANYFMMKLLVEVVGLYPTLSRLIAVGTVAFLSYNLHKVFTFRVKLPK